MSEETWEGELSIKLSGLEVGLGKIRLVRLEDREDQTVRVCPECLEVPEKIKHEIEYHCPKCNKDYKSWHTLKQAVPIDEKKGIPLPERNTTKTQRAKLSKLDLTKAKALVMKREYGIQALDDEAKKNLQIIGAMCKEFKKVVVFKLVFDKKGKEHLFYITVNDDNSLRARELIPMNRVRDLSMFETFNGEEAISGEELKRLMESIPDVKEEDLVLKSEVEKVKEQINILSQKKELKDLEQILKE